MKSHNMESYHDGGSAEMNEEPIERVRAAYGCERPHSMTANPIEGHGVLS